MPLIEVLSPGAFTTVQDLGRQGFGPMGISPSGAADPLALRIGNRLVGNPENAAALEMTLLGATLRFPDGAVVALAGSGFEASLENRPIDAWRSTELRPGETLRIGPTHSGVRCYLCVAGGIRVKPWLGSVATHVLSGLGGFHGRILRQNDALEIGTAIGDYRERALAEGAEERLKSRKFLRVTDGPQGEEFSEAARALFYASPYRVTEESNRVGLRLAGQPLPAPGGEMITEGVPLGAVQIPPSGQPIIVFVEQQTTGGYPVIASIISADLHCVGQLRPRDEFRFELVGLSEARELLREQEEWLASPGCIAQ